MHTYASYTYHAIEVVVVEQVRQAVGEGARGRRGDHQLPVRPTKRDAYVATLLLCGLWKRWYLKSAVRYARM